MSSSTIYRLSGVSLLIGGVLAAIGVAGQAVFPNFFSTGWVLMSFCIFIGLLFVLVGLPAVYAGQMKRMGTLGLIGFVLLFLACAIRAGSGGMTDLVVLPLLTKFNALSNPSLAFILFFTVQKFLLLISAIVFGIAALRAGALPKGAIILLLIGAALLLVGGRIHVIPYLDYLGDGLFCLSFAWFGSALLSQSRQAADIQPAPASSRLA